MYPDDPGGFNWSDVCTSNLPSCSEFDHSVDRQLEIGGDVADIVQHDGEQPFAPQCHSFAWRGRHCGATQKVGCFRWFEHQAGCLTGFKRARQIDLVLKAVVDRELITIRTQRLHRYPL